MIEQPKAPTVSVGLAVYNEERYVRSAVESILAQTYEDFELIISDNASADRSYQVCEEYAQSDSRVRLYRNDRNLGAAPNFNRLYELGRGKYFKWAFSDDLLLPRFLEATVAVLEADDSAVSCMTRAANIDEHGNRFGHRGTDPLWSSDTKSERLLGALRGNRMAIHGVSRVSALDRTVLHGSFADSDGNLMVELALQGRIAIVDEELYQIRSHPSKSTVQLKDPRRRQGFYNTDKLRRASTPTVTSIVEHLKSVSRHVDNPASRVALGGRVLAWYIVHRPRHVLGDIRTVLKSGTVRLLPGSKPVSA